MNPEYVNGDANGSLLDLNTGFLRVGGVGGIGRNFNIERNWKNFGPRLGIAYQLTPKTVLRMGYGRSYDIGVFGSIFGHAVTQNLPVLAVQNLNPNSQTDDVFNLAEAQRRRFSPRFRRTGCCVCLMAFSPGRVRTECGWPGSMHTTSPFNIS